MTPQLYPAGTTDFSARGTPITNILTSQTHTAKTTLDGAATAVFSIGRDNRLFGKIDGQMIVKLDSTQATLDDLFVVHDTSLSSDGGVLTVNLQQYTAIAGNYLVTSDILPAGQTPQALMQLLQTSTDRTMPLKLSSTLTDPVTTDSTTTWRDTSVGDSVTTLAGLTQGHVYRYQDTISIEDQSDSPVTINLRRGKNIKGLTVTRNWDSVTTRMVPRYTPPASTGTSTTTDDSGATTTTATDAKQQPVYGTTVVSPNADKYQGKTVGVDYSSRATTDAELAEAAAKYFSENTGIDQPEYTITVDVLDYGSKRLQTIGIDGTAKIHDGLYGIDALLGISSIEYDFLTGQNVAVTAGTRAKTILDLVVDKAANYTDTAVTKAAEQTATDTQQNTAEVKEIIIKTKQDMDDLINQQMDEAHANADALQKNIDDLSADADSRFKDIIGDLGTAKEDVTKQIKEFSDGYELKLSDANGKYVAAAASIEGLEDLIKDPTTGLAAVREMTAGLIDEMVTKDDLSAERKTTESHIQDAVKGPNDQIASMSVTLQGLQNYVGDTSISDRVSQLKDQFTQEISAASNDAREMITAKLGQITLGLTNSNGTAGISINLPDGGKSTIDLDADQIIGPNLIGLDHITLTPNGSNIDLSEWGETIVSGSNGNGGHLQIGSPSVPTKSGGYALAVYGDSYQVGAVNIHGGFKTSDNLDVGGSWIYMGGSGGAIYVNKQNGLLYYYGGSGWNHTYAVQLKEV